MGTTARTALASTLVASAALLGGIAWLDLAAARSCTVAGLSGDDRGGRWAVAELVVDDEHRSPRSDRAVEAQVLGADRPAEQATASACVRDTTLVELATWLASGEPSRSAWETALRATAASLDGSCAEVLERAAADPQRPVLECVAALELLRVLVGKVVASPSGSAVARVRSAWQEGELGATAASAAARALARFGEPADRLALAATLSGEDPERARAAAWGLCEAPACEVAGEVARLLVGTESSAAGQLAAAALGELARDADEVDRAALRYVLEPLASDTMIAAATRLRAVAILGRLGGSAATELLLGLLVDPGAEDELVRVSAEAASLLEDPVAAERLAAALARPELDERRRLLAAEAIARSAGRGADTSWTGRAAADHLAMMARTSPDSGLRRRSIASLGNLCGRSAEADARDVLCLAELAQFDGDARVRAAANRALENIDVSPTTRDVAAP